MKKKITIKINSDFYNVGVVTFPNS